MRKPGLRRPCDEPPLSLPRPLAEGEVLDFGGKRVRQVSTPHVPHNWSAQVLFEESTRTLTTPGTAAAATLRRLSALSPERLAIMHGASFEGDAGKALSQDS